MQSDQCPAAIHDHLPDMEKTLNKRSEKHKYWDKIFEQYNINNYQYIDQFGVLHKPPMQFIDSTGRVYDTPLHFLADFELHTMT